MQNVRRIILFVSTLIGVWVIVSFGGAMFDPANAAFWSGSLMWALLSCLIVMPALVMVNHASNQASKKMAQHSRSGTRPSQVPDRHGSSQSGRRNQEPFIQEESNETHTLWPEPEQASEWPPKESRPEQERARA